MKAPAAAQRRLLDLAELDARRARLQHQAKNLPEQRALRELEQARAEHRAWLVRATGDLEDAQRELRRLENDVELVEQRLDRDRRLIEHSSSVKDIQGLEGEVATLERRRDALEEQQLELLERLEQLEAELERARSSQSAVESEAAVLLERRDAARAELQDQAKQIGAARAQLLPEVPAELLALYEERRARYGIGAAELVGRVTTGSNVTLDPQDVARILAADEDEVVLCPDSSAILVRTERSAGR